jgi:hypothetical protein
VEWTDKSGMPVSALQWVSSPDNKQQSEETDIRVPAGIKPANPACERQQSLALDRATTGNKQ